MRLPFRRLRLSVAIWNRQTVNEWGCKHNYGSKATYVTKEATCMETGEAVWTCRNCGKEDVRTVAKLSHVYGDGEVTKSPTCTQDGVRTYVCLNDGCNNSTTKVIEAEGHLPITIDGVDPTCYSMGLTEGSICNDCEEILIAQEEIATLPHVWGDETITKKETCAETGLYSYSCQNEGCNATINKVVPTLAHTIVKMSAIAATCTESGWSSYSYCSECSAMLVDKVEIPATGHNYVTVKGISPTCYSTGLTDGVECENCGDVQTAQAVVDVISHDFDDTNGYVCRMCGVHEHKQTGAVVEDMLVSDADYCRCYYCGEMCHEIREEDGSCFWCMVHIHEMNTNNTCIYCGQHMHVYDELNTCTYCGRHTHAYDYSKTCGCLYCDDQSVVRHVFDEENVCKYCGIHKHSFDQTNTCEFCGYHSHKFDETNTCTYCNEHVHEFEYSLNLFGFVIEYGDCKYCDVHKHAISEEDCKCMACGEPVHAPNANGICEYCGKVRVLLPNGNVMWI